MIYDPGYVYLYPERIVVRNAVFAHFKTRGVPEHRWFDLWHRWQRQKGCRPPQHPPQSSPPTKGGVE
jgi:hypothetical protein